MSWVRYAHHRTQMFSRITLRRNIYTISFNLINLLRIPYYIFFIRNGIKEQLTKYLNDLNKKHNSIKFEYKILQTSIILRDTEAFIQNNKLVTNVYWKGTDRQNFLYVDLEHPKLIKNNILYSKALRIKQICTTKNDFNQYFQELKQQVINQGYKAELINKHKNSRKNCMEKTFKRISLVLKYNRSLPNISKVVRKHWNILSINNSFKEIFQNERVTAFKCNKNLKKIIGSNKI